MFKNILNAMYNKNKMLFLFPISYYTVGRENRNTEMSLGNKHMTLTILFNLIFLSAKQKRENKNRK